MKGIIQQHVNWRHQAYILAIAVGFSVIAVSVFTYYAPGFVLAQVASSDITCKGSLDSSFTNGPCSNLAGNSAELRWCGTGGTACSNAKQCTVGTSAPFNPTWQNIINVNTTVNSVSKTAPDFGVYDAGISSVESIAAGVDGYVEWTLGNSMSGSVFMTAGLNNVDLSPTWSDMDYGIEANGSTGLWAHGNGAFLGQVSTTYAVGDVLAVAVAGGQIRFYKNGVQSGPVVTSGITYPLRFDAAFWKTGTSITNVQMGLGRYIVSTSNSSYSTGNLTANTTYYLTCTGASGSTTDNATVNYFATPPLPTVTTSAATNVTGFSVQFNGSSNPNGTAATGWFRYGTSSAGCSALPNRYPASGGTSLGSGNSSVSYSITTTGNILSPNTTYYYCAAANNSGGTSYGTVLSFTTPVISISPNDIISYWGGDDSDEVRDIAVDAAGNIYVTGITSSANFPTTAGAYDTSFNGNSDAFMSIIASDGTLIYSTYLGGTGNDEGYAIEVDSSGNIYVAGFARSNFPTTPGVIQPNRIAGDDGFITKFDSVGNLIWSTYYGDDRLRNIAVDASENIYTYSAAYVNSSFITAGAYDTSRSGISDALITKLSSNGQTVIYGTYIGGSGEERGEGSIRVDSSGNAYVVFATNSTQSSLPAVGSAMQTSYGGGAWDAVLAKINPTGTGLDYLTYIGGNNPEPLQTHHLAIDSSGNAYVGMGTQSNDLPTIPGAFQLANAGNDPAPAPNDNFAGDGYIVKVSPTGARLAATYLGGFLGDGIDGIAVDSSGNVYVGGGTKSSNFPIVGSVAPPNFGGGTGDAFIAKLTSNLDALIYSSFIGGSANDIGQSGLAINGLGHIHIGGRTDSSDFPFTSNAPDKILAGSLLRDGIIVKIDASNVSPSSCTTDVFYTTAGPFITGSGRHGFLCSDASNLSSIKVEGEIPGIDPLCPAGTENRGFMAFDTRSIPDTNVVTSAYLRAFKFSNTNGNFYWVTDPFTYPLSLDEYDNAVSFISTTVGPDNTVQTLTVPNNSVAVDGDSTYSIRATSAHVRFATEDVATTTLEFYPPELHVTHCAAPTEPTNTTTLPAHGISDTSAILSGSTQPSGFPTTGWFRYSTVDPGTCNDTFGTRVPATDIDLGSGTNVVNYSIDTGNVLLPGTTYYYCAIAASSPPVFGLPVSFTTSVLPASLTHDFGLYQTVGAADPFVSNTTVTVTNSNYCSAGVHATVSGTYNDPLGSNLLAYQVMINGNHAGYNDINFDPNTTPDSTGVNPAINPEWRREYPAAVLNGGTFSATAQNCNASNPDPSSPTPLTEQFDCQMTWKTTYTAWARVLNGFAVWSPWVRMGTYNNNGVITAQNTWSTPIHQFPTPLFTFTPINPAVGAPVTFTDSSIFCNGGACGDASVGRNWTWTFTGGTPATSNIQPPPPISFTGAGPWFATLAVSDDVGACPALSQNIYLLKQIPRWREVAPR